MKLNSVLKYVIFGSTIVKLDFNLLQCNLLMIFVVWFCELHFLIPLVLISHNLMELSCSIKSKIIRCLMKCLINNLLFKMQICGFFAAEIDFPYTRNQFLSLFLRQIWKICVGNRFPYMEKSISWRQNAIFYQINFPWQSIAMLQQLIATC